MATTDIGRVTPIWRGFYSAATTYELNDIVIDTAGSVWWHKPEEITTGVAPGSGEIWDAVIDMSIFSGLIQAAITTAQTALAAAQAALADVAADMERAETAADNAENSAAAASESAAGVGALAQAAAASAEAAAGSATGAAGSAQAAAGSKSDAEAYAVGTRGGEDVETTDPTYHNNAKYYAEQAASEAEAAAQSAEDAQDVLDSIPEDYSQLSADVGDLKTQIGDVDGTYSEIGESIEPVGNIPRNNTQIGDNYASKLETSTTYQTKTLSVNNRKFRVTVRQYGGAARPLIMGVDTNGIVVFINTSDVVESTSLVTYIVELPIGTTMLSVSSYGSTWAGMIEEFVPNDLQTQIHAIDDSIEDVNNKIESIENEIGDLSGTYAETGTDITPTDGIVLGSGVEVGDAYATVSGNGYKTKVISVNTEKKYRVKVTQYKNAERSLIAGIDSGNIVRYLNTTVPVTSTGDATYEIELSDDVTALSVSSYGNSWTAVIEVFSPVDLQTQINNIKDDTDSLNERVDSIEEDIELNNNFYATIYHDEEDALVNRVMADKTIDTVTFGLITDTHNGARADRQTSSHARVINRLAERCGAGFVAHIGDVIEGYGATHEENQAYMIDYCSKQNDSYIPTLYTLSHHEQYGALGTDGWGNDPTALTPEECLSIEGLNKRGLNVIYSSDYANWYVDVYGIRFIGLNSTSVILPDISNLCFNQVSTDFLNTALTGCTLPVVVFSHVPSRRDLLTNGGTAKNWEIVKNKLDGYNNIFAFFHGHAHWDNIFKPDDENFPYICTCCAFMHQSTGSTEGVDGNPTRYPRDVNAYNRYCFDIVNIHINSGEIKMFRFGAGSDRTYTPS